MAFCSACGAQLSDDAKFCPQCGTATAGNATAATSATDGVEARPQPAPAYTPPPQVPQDSAGTRLILPLIAIVAIAIIAFVLWSQRDGTQPIAGGDRGGTTVDRPVTGSGSGATSGMIETGATTSAATLDAAFSRDPQGAALRYAGPLRISGVIATMVSPGPTPSLSLEGRTRFNFMIVNFPDGYRERLAPLSKGQFITVDCALVRSLGGTTILDGCTLA